MKITTQMVKELRDKTSAGMMDCKNALAETDGDLEAAVDMLRAKGLAAASAITLFALSASITGCEDAADETGDALEDAGEAVDDAVDDAGDAIDDATGG